MAKNKGFRVPLSEQTEFDRMVQRANRRIKASLEFIQKEDIKSESTIRSLVSDYGSPSKESWASDKTVFSRSKWFDSEKEYNQFKRHLEEWGKEGKNYDRSIENIKKGYYDNIIKALTTIAVDNPGVMTKNGRLPGNLAKKIRELSLEQLTNFFEYADPTEDIESQRFSSYDYLGVDRQDFVDITMARLNALKTIIPDKRVKETKTIQPKHKKRKTRKRKKK